jgi:hypothetical protein
MHEVKNRYQFAEFCNMRGLTGYAVEIGTDRGTFASQFIKDWKGEHLYCVDPYRPYDEMPGSRMGDLVMAAMALNRYSARLKLVGCNSIEAAGKLYPGRGYDFVYIDGCHEYESVAADIAAWWPRVKTGGILAGHDYGTQYLGVGRAVDEFVSRHDVELKITKDTPASWWFIKN